MRNGGYGFTRFESVLGSFTFCAVAVNAVNDKIAASAILSNEYLNIDQRLNDSDVQIYPVVRSVLQGPRTKIKASALNQPMFMRFGKHYL